MRVGRDRGVLPIVGHLATAFGLAAAHVALYSFIEHDGPVRVFTDVNQNQLTGNVIIYFAIVAWAHSREFYAWFRERELAASRIEAALARSRYQAMCVQLRPQLLLGTLERLERLVHEDVPRAERLIARLADVLRMTLDSASDAVTTLRKELEMLRAYVEVYELGVRQRLDLAVGVPSELLATPVPNRLLRAILDDMLAGLPLAARAWVTVDAERTAHATRVRVRLDSESPKHGADGVEPWSVSVEAAALAEADRRVSLFFPDSRSALIVLADDEDADEAAPREPDTMPAAKPA
jgi:LytS/YehU family sensor histidine kinase